MTRINYLITLIICFFCTITAFSQATLTLEKALEIASENSPSIIQARLNLEGREAALEAQKAALKSKVSLNLNPFQYSRERRFDSFNSRWNTESQISTSGAVIVTQPITPTDGTITLYNNTGWSQNYSEFGDTTVSSYFNNQNDLSNYSYY